MPSPVMRIAPYPNRFTVNSPPSEMVPAAAADNVCVGIFVAPFSNIGTNNFFDDERRPQAAKNFWRREIPMLYTSRLEGNVVEVSDEH